MESVYLTSLGMLIALWFFAVLQPKEKHGLVAAWVAMIVSAIAILVAS